MEQKIFIFDVDGTLTNASHRQHHVRQKPKRWDLFNAKMHLDTPHDDIIWLAKLFYDLGHMVIICSGRGSEKRQVTMDWLEAHGVKFHGLYMRKEKDSRSDDIVKAELLARIREEIGEPFMAFDDRNQVVDMWRANGIRCCQVAPGDF
jgi:phosphoglycolate phosphatase-like HAD superfamily hydrolase